jgi:hypothetical protein
MGVPQGNDCVPYHIMNEAKLNNKGHIAIKISKNREFNISHSEL